MAQENINTGSSANDGTGTPMRNAFSASQNNFTELYENIDPSNLFNYVGGAEITGSLRLTGSLTSNGDIRGYAIRAEKYGNLNETNDCFISMSDENMWFVVADSVMMEQHYDNSANEGYVKFNLDEQDIDFKVSGDTLSNLFYVNAGTNRVGINTSAPATLFDVNGKFRTATMRITNLQDGASGLAQYDLFYTSSEYFGASSPYYDVVCINAT